MDPKKRIKKEIRLIGIDDSPFEKGQKGEVLVLGTIHRGGSDFEGLISTTIEKDGWNSTDRITEMINRSRHKDQLQCIMIDGIAVGGFNVIDINELADRTRLPVIVVVRRQPNMEMIANAIQNVPDHEKKMELMKKAGKVYEYKVNDESKMYFQVARIHAKKARQVLKISITRGNMPEPIRTAHIIAAGIVLGESKGRA